MRGIGNQATKLMEELLNKGVSPVEMLTYILNDYMHYKNAIQVMQELEDKYFFYNEEEFEYEGDIEDLQGN